MMNGYQRRNEEEWDRTRNLMAYQLNFGGMGTKKPYLPSDIIRLRRDEINVKRPIKSMLQAMKILKHFENG
jgi:hypothetical protein